MPICPDCGAIVADGSACRAMFDELLALEYAAPSAFGAVHHLTVAAYSLQHPRGYSRAVIRGWRTMIAESLDGLATPADFLRRAREEARRGVKLRVLEPGGEPPVGWPREWPMTVADVVVPLTDPPDAEGHIDRVRRWAASIRATLDTVGADAEE